MKISLNWLREYIDLPEDLTMEKLAYDLTMRTVEVEGFEDLSKKYENIVAGKITEVRPHPDADKLKVVMVDIGEGEDSQIVCGGSNLEVGTFVVVSKPGSYVVWHGEGDPVKIKKTKMRGVDSFGMICGANEVGLEGLYPAKDEHEIVVLKEDNIKPGDNIADVLDFNDFVLEIDNKSLTNRPDLYCHYGIARELSAIYGLPLKEIEEYKMPEVAEYPLSIESKDRCRRYAAVVIDEVDSKESPTWLKASLAKIGMRPINILVDITNYIMLSVGEPTHAFDFDHVSKGIIVRDAKEGEVLELLDGKKLNLDSKNLVIANDTKPIGLAGVMGGKDDSILPTTGKIVLELANFTYESVRHSAKEFNIRTEASIRFEKDLDTQRVDQAISLGMKLFKELLPDSKIVAFADVSNASTKKAEVELTLSFLRERLGIDIKADDVESLLKPLGFKVQVDGDKIVAIAPTWRSTGDIGIKDDILEEVARMIGYENFEPDFPMVRLNPPINQKDFDKERSIKEYLAFTCGFREIFSYPWVEDVFLEAVGVNGGMVRLADPPSPTSANLRSELVSTIISAVELNKKYFDEFRIFEMASVHKEGESSPTSPDEVLPIEELHLAGAIVGTKPLDVYFALKGVLEGLNNLQIQPIGFSEKEGPAWADKKLWQNIESNGEIIGSLGLVSLKAKSIADIKNAEIAIFDLNVEKLVANESRENSFKEMPLFPAVEKDLSVLIDEGVRWSEIEETIAPIVKKLSFVDEYKGAQIPEGKKSITLRFEDYSNEKTLTTEDIDKKFDKILRKLEGRFGAELRG
ncbi:MAG: phenylalanine--tRNA ligase subunit beta [Tissierellia bacterium]|nr:phenylalanine--tRNA ligase subunit beta [Tissierellia bacterium]